MKDMMVELKLLRHDYIEKTPVYTCSNCGKLEGVTIAEEKAFDAGARAAIDLIARADGPGLRLWIERAEDTDQIRFNAWKTPEENEGDGAFYIAEAAHLASRSKDQKRIEELEAKIEMLNEYIHIEGREKEAQRVELCAAKGRIADMEKELAEVTLERDVSETNECRCPAQLTAEREMSRRLAEALGKIAARPDLPNPNRDADWKTCMKFSSAEAREALDHYRRHLAAQTKEGE